MKMHNSISKPPRMTRSQKGNMTVLVVLCVFLFMIFFVAILNAMLAVFSYHATGNVSDKTALELGRELNDQNRLGDLLDCTKCSRELVFSDRENCQKTTFSRFKLYAPLSSLLIKESRQGAMLLEDEHRKQIESCIAKVRNAVNDFNYLKRSKSQFDNVVTARKRSRITDVEIGYCKYTPASVQNTDGQFRELDLYDIQVANCDEKNGYFKPLTNAKLPYDDDIKFSFDSLSPAINNEVTPGKLVSTNSFVTLGRIFEKGVFHHKNIDLVPSAIKVTQSVEIQGLPDKEIAVSAVAATTGAQTPPWKRSRREVRIVNRFVDPGEPGYDSSALMDTK